VNQKYTEILSQPNRNGYYQKKNNMLAIFTLFVKMENICENFTLFVKMEISLATKKSSMAFPQK
jgi:hypothetical protein